MKNKLVWVELGNLGQVVRIFKNKQAACAFHGHVFQVPYFIAVGEIRHQLWLRCKGVCELCGDVLTEKSGHMHEQKHRGQGGEISLANSVFICPTCHKAAHHDRNPRWKKDLTFKIISGSMKTDSSIRR